MVEGFRVEAPPSSGAALVAAPFAVWVARKAASGLREEAQNYNFRLGKVWGFGAAFAQSSAAFAREFVDYNLREA